MENRSRCCSWRCLDNKRTELYLDVAIQRPELELLHWKGLRCSWRYLHQAQGSEVLNCAKTTEACAASGLIFTTEPCSATGRVSSTGARAAPGHVFTTESCAALRRVYFTTAWASPGCVYTSGFGTRILILNKFLKTLLFSLPSCHASVLSTLLWSCKV